MKISKILLGFLMCSLFFFSTDTYAKITKDNDLEIRILYDNSGSMFPGYTLEEPPGKKRRTKVKFFHEYPEFREWLNKLIFSQRKLNGKRISITTFTEHELEEILPPTPRENVNYEKIVEAFDNSRGYGGKFKSGQYTYLKKNLESFIQGFEGIVWLITDNIVEQKGSDSYQDILRFFRSIKDKYEYKAVHLYQYPFEDTEKDQISHLAIYGMMISSEGIDKADAKYFDKKFFGLLPGLKHLKLKDLSVRAIELIGDIKVEVLETEGGIFYERQKVRLRLESKIHSRMTHHTVDSAKYKISVVGPFNPDSKAKKEFGVKGIPSSLFEDIPGQLRRPIPPEGFRDVKKIMESRESVTIPFQRSGIISFIKSAFGVKVKYKGKVRFSVYDVKVTQERSYLAGIFGIDQASEVFDFQDIRQIEVDPEINEQSFYLETGSGRGIFLLLLLLLLLLPLGFLVWYFLQKKPCRIRVDQNTDTISFRPMGTYPVKCEQRIAGVVKRGIGKDFTFSPLQGFADMTVTPRSQPGKYDVTIQNRSFAISIEPLGGGIVKTGGGRAGGTGSGSTSGSRFGRPGIGGSRPGPSGGPTGGSTPPPPPSRRKFKRPSPK